MRQSDISKAIRATLAEGLFIDRVEIEDGRVVLVTSHPERRKEERAVVDGARAAAAKAAATATAKELIELGKARRRAAKLASPL